MIPWVVALTGSTPDVGGAMNTALGQVGSDALGAIANIVPVAAPILGGILVVGIAIKAFKKITGK